MKVIVGLGNPGKEYQSTRHNLGFMVLDQLAVKLGVQFSAAPKLQAEIAKLGSEILLCKPQTFMNNSGQAVRALLDYYKLFNSEKLGNLSVVHDDLDLAFGTYKLQLGTGPKAHNGLLSLYDHLGTKDFWHVRGGVDNRGDLRAHITPSEYVLQPFTTEEQSMLTEEITAIVSELMAGV